MSLMTNDHASLDRRAFLSRLLAGAMTVPSLSLLADLHAAEEPAAVPATIAGPTVRLGMIGCGSRGSWIAERFRQHGGFSIAAAADYFPDKVAAFGEKFGIPRERRFTGLDGFQRVLASGAVDAVAIESPPFFHPGQAAAAVDAGRHVYLAKPVAVDVPGCRTVEDSARRAGERGLVFLVDFQTRAQPLFLEALKRVQRGAIGTIAFGDAVYHNDDPFEQAAALLEERPGDPEARLRAWGLDRALSGDCIVEQFVHVIDVAMWAMAGRLPVSATGAGGRLVRQAVGTCWDSFQVQYRFDDHVAVSLSGRQFSGHGCAGTIHNRMFGTQGVLETEYGGTVMIRGKEFYRGGKTPIIYQEGADNNIAAFHHAITTRDATNPTVAPSVLSTLVGILGRTSAYEGRTVTWQELEQDKTRLVPDLAGLAI